MRPIDADALIPLIQEDKIEEKTLGIMKALGDGLQAETLNQTCDRHIKIISSLPTIDAVPREDYESTIYAREQNAYDRGLLDGRKSAPWNVITKRPMTAEERTEWEEHIGAMLFDEEAFLYGNLPEYDKECLVYSKWGRIFIDTLQDEGECGCYWENDGDMESIIAWMPLPEPYKAEVSE